MSVPENMLKDAYAYDANGYLDGTTVWQAIDGVFCARVLCKALDYG